MNSVNLVGRLTRDAELSFRGELAVCAWRVAVDRPGRSRDDRADFVDVACFGPLAEAVAGLLTRGRLVGVTGRLRWSEWETAEGQRRGKTDVVADSVQLLDPPPNTGKDRDRYRSGEDGDAVPDAQDERRPGRPLPARPHNGR